MAIAPKQEPRCDVVKLVECDEVGSGDCGLNDFPEGASSPLYMSQNGGLNC